MYNIKKISSIRGITYALTALTLLLAGSCKKFVTIPPPQDQVVSTTVFSNDNTALAAVSGIYSQMMGTGSSLMTGALTVYPGMSADEFRNVKSSTSYDPFSTNSLLKTNATVQSTFWKFSYSYIYMANNCIEGLHASTGVSADMKKQLLGECFFVRAYCYFYLAGLFGDVPLETTTDYKTNQVAPRTSSAKVLDQIVADLDSARSLLLPAYPTAGRVRANKWAATALQARAFLYQKNWQSAENAASAVINAGMYKLVSDINAVFLATSNEAILQFKPVLFNQNTPDGSFFIPAAATTVPTFTILDTTVKSFEPGDLRKTSWVRSATISGVTYYYPYKYKVRASTTVTEYNIVERLAEQYLIRAEARAQQNNLAGALADLDSIRVRAGLPILPSTLDQTACILAVEQERRIELLAEWGHRWLDLRRTGRIDAVLSGEKTTWSPTAALFPIPYAEILKNTFLTQNAGYQ